MKATEKKGRRVLRPSIEAEGTHSAPPETMVEKNPRPDRRVAWEWNLPLLRNSGIVTASVLLVVGLLYWWQSNRISSAVLAKAEQVEVEGDRQSQQKWLSRYIQLVPSDTDSLIKLAILEDDLASEGVGNIDQVRRRLSIALAACGIDPELAEEQQQLRERLVNRLLAYDSTWAIEAEKQVLALNAPAADPQVSKWLARALFAQQMGSDIVKRDSQQFDPQVDYWNWFVSQPLGEVLLLAYRANPSDLELAELLIDTYLNRPYLFAVETEKSKPDAGQHAPGEADTADANPTVPAVVGTNVAEQIAQIVLDLEQRQAEGRAQRVAYMYYARTAPQLASALLQTTAPLALARIEQSLASTEQRDKAPAINEAMRLAELAGSMAASEASNIYVWDWMLCLDAARDAAVNDRRDEAKRIYAKLVELDSPQVPRLLRESTYVSYGQLLSASGDRTAAIEVWQQGTERVEESLQLIAQLATGYASQRNVTEALTYIEELNDVIKILQARLDGPRGAELTTAGKRTINLRLDTARWEAGLLQSQLDLLRGNLRRAASLAKQAFADPGITSDQKLQSGVLLAECYRKLQLWDLEGEVLDSCISLLPNNTELRQLAAIAWQRAGATERATEQLEKIDDGTFGAAVEIARLVAASEAAKAGQRSDFFAVRRRTEEARRRYQAATAEQQIEMELWRLELLELGIASVSELDAASAQLESTKLRLDRLEQVAAANPLVKEVQQFAVDNLAADGRTEAALTCIHRLEEIAAKSGSVTDQADLAIAKAGLELASGRLEVAIGQLEAAIRDLPEEQLRLAKYAANAVLSSDQPETPKTVRAVQLLRMLPEDQFDLAVLTTMATAGMVLLQNGVDAVNQSEIDHWISLVRQQEGTAGTQWRLLEAQRHLASGSIEALEQAERLFNEIDRLRPRWGRAAALGARIAARKGFSEDAIRLYRRALRDGDNQVSTVLGLVGELMRVDRPQQAREELQRLEGLSESVFPVAKVSIDLAKRSGLNSEAIAEARELVKQFPEDGNYWRVLAQAIYEKLRAPQPPAVEERKSLLDEGWQALDMALKLTPANSVEIWNERIQFAFIASGVEGARAELLDFEAQSLKGESAAILASRWYLQLRDAPTARLRAEAAVARYPNSLSVHLNLADIHEQTGNIPDAVTLLRAARTIAPDHQPTRERLAVMLAVHTPAIENPEEIRREVDELIGSVSDASSEHSRLICAVVNLLRGEQEQQQAISMLEALAQSPTSDGRDAMRVLANFYTNKWANVGADSTELTSVQREWKRQTLELREQLVRSPKPLASDLATLIDLLLKASAVELAAGDETSANVSVNKALANLTKLEEISGSSLVTLQFRIRTAFARNNAAELRPIVENWLANVERVNPNGKSLAMEAAGIALLDLVFHDEALHWLEQAYRLDRGRITSYVIGLTKAGKYQQAIDLCTEEYQNDSSTQFAVFIAEAAVLLDDFKLNQEGEDVLSDALSQPEGTVELFEAVGSLRLLQQRYAEAIGLFQKVELLAKDRVRTLNNMAIAYSELPSGRDLALGKIDRAIQLQGEVPELLDTRGIVLTRLGRFAEARQMFLKALEKIKDVRFQIHLAQAAMADNDRIAVQAIWSEIAANDLDLTVLTSEERAFIGVLQQQFSGEAVQ